MLLIQIRLDRINVSLENALGAPLLIQVIGFCTRAHRDV